ncbi:MAG: SRPBCC family protein [Nitrospirae bacterium]|nr:SRPBCC family protein [Nitrospirota bacterium]MBI3593764.1 SRPBCC family protein [Nitrospirota bacterium]
MPLSKNKPDPKLDLVFNRFVDVSPELIWKAWTTPAQIKKWFTPAPWKTIDCEIDLRPGGIFRTIMQSPEGKEMVNIGCYLDLIKNRKLVWTDALLPGYRPSPNAFFTAVVLLEPHHKGTKYTATVIHKDEEGRKKHEEMGFHEGWGKALDQLLALVKKKKT